jgi:hypothetical protein
MGLMYSWATKEYLLWDMTIGQIIMYNNYGWDIKNGKEEEPSGFLNKSEDELRAIRDEYKKQYGEIE